MYIKSIVLLAALGITQLTNAQSALTKLPFGIVIGHTTNEEIENRGTCVEMTKDSESCKTYDIAGNFFVHTSENKVVNKIRFSAGDGNKLPRKWREIGLAFGLTNEPGTLDIDFMNIIKSNGAKFIDTSRAFDEQGEVQGIIFTFEIDNLAYTVLIRTDLTDGAKTDLLGLYEVEITESY